MAMVQHGCLIMKQCPILTRSSLPICGRNEEDDVNIGTRAVMEADRGFSWDERSERRDSTFQQTTDGNVPAIELGLPIEVQNAPTSLKESPHPYVSLRSIDNRNVCVVECPLGEVRSDCTATLGHGLPSRRGFFASAEDERLQGMPVRSLQRAWNEISSSYRFWTILS